MFPLRLRNATKQDSLLNMKSLDEVEPNITAAAQSYAEKYKVEASDLFYHALAVLHAQQYRIENAGALRQDWPRIPLPSTRDVLVRSAELGRKIAALLNTEEGALMA
jgi:predicted helicase